MGDALDIRFELASEDARSYFHALNRACYEAVIERQFGPWDEDHQNGVFEIKWPTQNFRKIYVKDMLVWGVWIDDAPDFVQLREIQIHPDHQGRGIGKEVIRRELADAHVQGKRVRLRVLFQNHARRLHERLGLAVVDRNDHQSVMECPPP